MADLAGWLLDPYASGFMQRALAASLLVGAVAPLVGVWIVLRRLAYLGDAMSHATLGGVGAAYVAGVSITIGAVAAGVLMAGLMTLLSRHPRIREDSVIGAVEVFLFALGVLVIAAADDVRVDVGHLLFGSVYTVGPGDLAVNAGLAAAAVAALVAFHEDLRAATFDPLHARLVGVRVDALQAGLLALLAVAVVLSLGSVGLLMSVALFVVPPAAARLWTQTVIATAAAAVAIGLASVLAGLTAAYHLGTPPGATIALAAVAILALSLALTRPRRARLPAAHAADLR